MMRSWYEVQSMAERAALGLGVPFSQAARFGAAVARHLAEGRPAGPLAELLEGPEQIIALSLEVERAVELASTSGATYRVSEGPQIVAASFMHSLPCDVRIEPALDGLDVRIDLETPQGRTRPTRIEVPNEVWDMMETLAARTYVPESAASQLKGAGAGLMELD